MQMRTVLVIVIGILLMALVAGYACAADKPTSVGYVDVQKVFYECEDAKKGTADLRTQGELLQKKLERMNERRLLSADQRKEAETLDAADKPTDVQKKRLDELTAEAKKYEDELKNLQQITTPDETQKVRLNELTSRGRDATTKIDELQQAYTKDLNDKNQAMSNKIQDRIKTAIADVGKNKGISTIVDKQVILFGGIDLTEEVMKQVNKK